jgi:hypothetical protein
VQCANIRHRPVNVGLRPCHRYGADNDGDGAVIILFSPGKALFGSAILALVGWIAISFAAHTGHYFMVYVAMAMGIAVEILALW